MDIKRFPEKMGDLPIDFSNPKRTLHYSVMVRIEINSE